MGEFKKLSEAQLDVIREVCNIGAGNGATALATMLGQRVEMSVPEINIVSYQEILEASPICQETVYGIYQKIKGQAPGEVLWLLPQSMAQQLVEMLLQRSVTETGSFNQFELSALAEVGNIVTGGFLAAITGFTGIRFYPSIPGVALDYGCNILSSVAAELGHVSNEVLIIETIFKLNHKEMIGHFFLLPEPDSLRVIVTALGV
ncbi:MULTISPECIES: chemotaxis protein CheC [Carboxydocella]|uniref:Chemotaxis protein CheC n=2 Tax=Carboxydocella TaxID=178898 RepID=A0A1T4P8J2_9FIRM|nr:MULTISPECIES: chemotaxis protein CheC [Carboxydocella]AVX20746.1 chemotaxis protein CheC [Carboxydocella thermautotrophica]GAW28275.1 chemotaxis protein CheY [Carboxydocella sp. ULO1]GAW32154.1 chemotaxis protein CheY [Carboxydocella sp. JDF658]SJZ87880.1 chemotaxis protein CheC [Carboxydocella sporoproducens DSM 16521]